MEIPPNCISKAIHIASIAHKGQFRKDGTPYIDHCMSVATTVSKHYELFYNEKLHEICIAVAWLHDTIEDTTYTLNMLLEDFGPTIYHYVIQLTNVFKEKNSPVGWNREQRKKAEHARLRMTEREVQYIKAIDRMDNLLSLGDFLDYPFIKLYLIESRDLYNHLTEIHDNGLGQELDNIIEQQAIKFKIR